MDEPERNYLSQQIQELERSKRRWKLATIILAATLLINLIVGGASSLVMLQQHQVMVRQALAERERADMARQQAEEAARQLRQKAEDRQQH